MCSSNSGSSSGDRSSGNRSRSAFDAENLSRFHGLESQPRLRCNLTLRDTLKAGTFICKRLHSQGSRKSLGAVDVPRQYLLSSLNTAGDRTAHVRVQCIRVVYRAPRDGYGLRRYSGDDFLAPGMKYSVGALRWWERRLNIDLNTSRPGFVWSPLRSITPDRRAPCALTATSIFARREIDCHCTPFWTLSQVLSSYLVSPEAYKP